MAYDFFSLANRTTLKSIGYNHRVTKTALSVLALLLSEADIA